MKHKDVTAQIELHSSNIQPGRTVITQPLVPHGDMAGSSTLKPEQTVPKMAMIKGLDEIVRLAAHICQTPVALLCLPDGTQQWFPSEASLEVFGIATNSALGAFAVFQPDLLVIRDTWDDVSSTASSIVKLAPCVRFYAGMPLNDTKNHLIGSLCVMDVEPHELRPEQTESLRILSQHALTLIESHQAAIQALQESESTFRLLVQSVKDYAIYMLDPNGYVISWNNGGETINGYQAQEIIGQHFSKFYPQEDIQRGKPERVLRMAAAAGRFEDETWRMRKDGSKFWASVVITALKDKDGQLKGFAKVTRDITLTKRAQEQLIHNAFHDMLTSLPNRALLIERLGRELRHAHRHENYLFAVLFLDIDRFKLINESLGHGVGDQLLKGIARRLTTCLGSTNTTIARFAGDSFTVILEDIKDISDATRVASKIQQELTLPFQLNGHEIFTSASIGIAVNVKGSNQPEDLLRDAEIAMFRAKTRGRACYEVFDTTMHARALMQLQLESDLRRAIERQELRVFYQPIVSLVSGKLTGFEALLRWQHPQRGWVSPVEFIPLAEETSLILSIDWWVIREACRQMRDWQMRFLQHLPLTMSVNLSGKQFLQPNLLEHLDMLLQETGLDGRYLKIEITEGILIDNPEAATAMLEQLRERRIQLCIDDFGTGYSSLSYLHRFPLNILKIDRSFVSRLAVDSQHSAIVQAILSLAHNLGMQATAEGIETAEQMAQLQAMQCEYGQGYLISKPLDSKAAERLIADGQLW